MARPTEYDIKIAEEVCGLVQDGMNIKAALATKEEYPSFPTWCRWKRQNDELRNLYINAIQDKAEDVDYRIDKTIEDLKKGDIEPSAANVIIQSYKWKAAKYYPKMFGDKSELDVTTKGESLNKKPDLSNLSDEEILQFGKLNKKAKGIND